MVAGCVVAKKRGAKPRGNPPKVLVTMKVNQTFKDWLVSVARQKRLTPSQVIEFGLIALAKAEGLPEPPER
jgi:hypothetical protein